MTGSTHVRHIERHDEDQTITSKRYQPKQIHLTHLHQHIASWLPPFRALSSCLSTRSARWRRRSRQPRRNSANSMWRASNGIIGETKRSNCVMSYPSCARRRICSFSNSCSNHQVTHHRLNQCACIYLCVCTSIFVQRHGIEHVAFALCVQMDITHSNWFVCDLL